MYSVVLGSLLAGLMPSQATGQQPSGQQPSGQQQPASKSSAQPQAAKEATPTAPIEQKGWVKPSPDELRVLYKAQFKRDLGEFELLKSYEEEWTRPYITNDGARLFVGTRSGRLLALDVSSGKLKWERRDMGTMGVGMLEHGDNLIAGSDSDVVAVNRTTGKTVWRLDIDGRIGGLMAVHDDIAVVPVRPNAFVGVQLSDGKQLWRTQRQTPDGITVRGQATPVIDGARKRAYLGFSDGALLAVNLDDGGTRWIAQIGKKREFFADVDAAPILLDDGKSLLAASYNGGLARLDAETGSVIFKNAERLHITGLTAVDNNLVIASYGDGQILGLYASSGKVRWRYRLKYGAPTRPVYLGDGMAMVGCTEGPVTFVQASTGKPVQIIDLSSGVSVTPYIGGRHLAIMSNTGLLLVYRRS